MTRSIAALAVALGCSCVISVTAQETTTTTTKTEGSKVTTITYSGCMQNGTEAKSLILAKVQPVSRTTETAIGTSGVTTTTTTSYGLVPDEKVELQPHVGHKVEVTGMLIPAGESKTKTETKVEREGAPDTKSTETVKTNAPLPQFRVMSVKDSNESCE